MNQLVIQQYNPQYKAALLDLLLKLQVDYFKKTVSERQQALSEASDEAKAYGSYVDFLEEEIKEGIWNVLLALDNGKVVGMIIGSITVDDDLMLSPVGKVEDWFVEESYRGRGAGAKLYAALEKWFVEKGCKQVLSDTWMDNALSIEVHKHLGFFVTGIQFGKRL